MPEVKCKACGRTFTTYPSVPRIYCSQACKVRDKTVEKTCVHCRKRYVAPKSLAHRPYCSRDCMIADEQFGQRVALGKTKERVIVNCKTCGKPVEVLASKAWRKKYCSRSCRSKNPEIISKLYRGGKVNTACVYCGTPIVRYKSQCSNAVGSFCNMTCLGSYLAQSPGLYERLLQMRVAAGEAPNKLEQYVLNNFPQLTYTGAGGLWIKIGERRKCPDFILEGSNKLLEVWGNYWHDGQNPEEVINAYGAVGYECMVVWESDIRKDWQATRRAIDDYLNQRMY